MGRPVDSKNKPKLSSGRKAKAQTKAAGRGRKDNRTLMAEERAVVKQFLRGKIKGMTHLGERPKSLPQAVRVIIALQDRLDKTINRHKRATEHIQRGMQNIETGRELNDMLRASNYQMMEEINRLETSLQQANKQISWMSDRHGQKMQCTTALLENARAGERKAIAERDAVVTAHKLLS